MPVDDAQGSDNESYKTCSSLSVELHSSPREEHLNETASLTCTPALETTSHRVVGHPIIVTQHARDLPPKEDLKYRREDDYFFAFDEEEHEQEWVKINYKRYSANYPPVARNEVKIFRLNNLNLPLRPSNTTSEVSYWAWYHLEDLKKVASQVSTNWAGGERCTGGGPTKKFVLLANAHSRCSHCTDSDDVSFPEGANGYKVTPQAPMKGDSGVGKRFVYPQGSIGIKLLHQVTDEDRAEAIKYPKGSKPAMH